VSAGGEPPSDGGDLPLLAALGAALALLGGSLAWTATGRVGRRIRID